MNLTGKACLIGLFTGITSGLMGVGGGVLMVPAMVLLMGFTQHIAHGTSVAIMIMLAAPGALMYALNGTVNWPMALTISIGGVVGANIGARYMKRIPAFELKLVFCVFVALTGLRMIWAAYTGNVAGPTEGLEGVQAVVAGLGTGLAAGMLSGILGVGGGIITVPVMSLLLGVGQQTAQGTSLAAIIPTALSGTRTHYRAGSLNLKVGMFIGIGGVPGSLLGSALANSLPSATLKGIFGTFLIVMSVVLALRNTTGGGNSGK